ncbi:hypothetical protein L2K20_24195 [Mycobacterium sp. MBM]|nr:hypothetical protein [Mycobacterium sp. MBM]
MKTVLGLSVTSAGVGWVLTDGTKAGGRPVDDDEFVVHDLDELIARCLAAVRGAQAIATSSGRSISAIGVCCSDDVTDQVGALLAELRTAGFGDVRSVRQIVPTPRGDSEHAMTERPERHGLCGLLGDLLGDGGEESETEDIADFVDHDVTAGPQAAQRPAYSAAQAVLTNAVPPEPAAPARTPRRFGVPRPTVPAWAPPRPGARVMTMAAAAAVAAVIAVVAVGSQFVGARAGQPGEAALAGRTSASIAETTAMVPSAPPAVQPLAVTPAPAPVVDEVITAPVQLALPQPEPVAQPPAAVEPPVSAVPLTVPQLPETVAEAPVPPAADPAVPVAAPLPVDPAAPVAPPEVLPPPPPPPPPPFWLLPPFAPAPPPPVPAEQLPPPVAAEPVPAPAPAVNPVFGALP